MRSRGQSTIEYATAFIAVVFAIIAMSQFVKFAAAGRLKSSADSLSSTPFSPLGGQIRLQHCNDAFARSVGVGGVLTRIRQDEARDATLLPDPADPGAVLDRLPPCATPIPAPAGFQDEG